MFEILEETLIDGIRLLPFLFAAYLVMEWLEHKTSDHTRLAIRNAGHWGPLLGGLFGAVPQCGFSAAAANLYAGKIITMGTLLAIFLSTSDEMLPIFLSEKVPAKSIFVILGIKIVIGVLVGYLVDLFTGRYVHMGEELRIGNMCEKEHCHCDRGLFKSALKHTLHIFFFILLVSFLLNLAIEGIGEEQLGHLVIGKPFVGQMIAGVVGLIPNCAASVVLTELYLGGIISFGSMLAGLLVGAGVGLLVLFRMNHSLRNNLMIIGFLYGSGVVFGILMDLLGVTVAL